VNKALYCLTELENIHEDSIHTQTLQKLLIIFMEDIENVSLIPNVQQHIKDSKLSELVAQLALSNKARVCSHLRAVFHSKYKANREHYPSLQSLWKEIEENKSDNTFESHLKYFIHYLEQKHILAVYYAFQIEASEHKLVPKVYGRSQPVWAVFQELKRMNIPHMDTFMEWYKTYIGTLKEGYLCWSFPLLQYIGIITQGEVPPVNMSNYVLNSGKVEIDVPKKKGEWNEVEPQASFVNPLWKSFYDDGKRLDEHLAIQGEAKKTVGGMTANKKRGPKVAKQVVAAEPVVPQPASVPVVEAPVVAAPVVAAPIVAAPVVEPVVAPPPEVVEEKPKVEAMNDTQVPRKIKPEITISKMNDNFVFIDNLYRSRITLLDILEARGYQVDMYRKFSPAEATAAAAASSLASLNFIVSKKGDASKKCDVRYANVSRPKLETFFNDIEDKDSENVEVIVMSYAPVMDAHHAIALKQYMKLKEEPNEKGEKVRRKLRVSFFCIDVLVVNPLKHVLVPKHEIVPEEQHKELMASMYITAKSKFPEIKFHADPIARCIGAVPGDIVKITRPSASSGETIIYRVCAP
jgi:DNA-directed RNA polymerase subunit H (RpoH/RPB5)